MSRLRLAAGCAVLRLAQEPCYHEIITLEQYQLCALVINVRPDRGCAALHYKTKAVKSPLIAGLVCFNDKKSEQGAPNHTVSAAVAFTRPRDWCF